MECQKCGDEADELFKVKVGKKTMKLCEQCADEERASDEIAGEAEGAMRGMMEYKGK